MPENWQNLTEQRSICPETVHYKQIEVQAALYGLVAQSFPSHCLTILSTFPFKSSPS
jgi:hypothetical protein